MIAGSAVVVAVSLAIIILYNPPSQEDVWPTSGFPYCLRVLQCSNIAEFEGIPFEEILVIAKNYDACFEDYKIEQTCNVQVSQDIERYHELGYVAER